MNVETTKIKQTQTEQKTNVNTPKNDTGVKFSEELKDLEINQPQKPIENAQQNFETDDNVNKTSETEKTENPKKDVKSLENIYTNKNTKIFNKQNEEIHKNISNKQVEQIIISEINIKPQKNNKEEKLTTLPKENDNFNSRQNTLELKDKLQVPNSEENILGLKDKTQVPNIKQDISKTQILKEDKSHIINNKEKVFANSPIEDKIETPQIINPKIEKKINRVKEKKTENLVENKNNFFERKKKIVLVNDKNLQIKNSESKNLKENSIDNALKGLNEIVKELSQSDENKKKIFKKKDNSTDIQNMINNDFSIQDKDALPQMNPNMNFGSDSQPFSSFMNENSDKKQNRSSILGNSKQDLAEEAAIMSTMAENIAIANKNKIVQPKKSEDINKTDVKNIDVNNKVITENITNINVQPKKSEDINKTDVKNIDVNNKVITENITNINVQPKEVEIIDETGIKKIEINTGIVTENIVKFDTVIMNQADVEVFTDLVQKGETNLNNLAPQAAEKSVQVSKTLSDMLAKSMENNQPLRIDFDNNISVIIRISRDGKISADFLPSSQVAEAYLKENLPLLRQKFDDNNLDYESLNQRERRENPKENNRRKGRNNE